MEITQKVLISDFENGDLSNRYRVGDTDTRPWGSWTVLEVGDGFVVKSISLNSGARQSLQYHNHREETWVIVSGEGVALVGDQERHVKTGDVVIIPKRETHRLTCSKSAGMHLIEVQHGDKLLESDIVRLADDFGRI